MELTLDKLEVFDIGDEPIPISIQPLENLIRRSLINIQVQEVIGLIQQSHKLTRLDLPIIMMRYQFTPVHLLQGHLTTMPLNQKRRLSLKSRYKLIDIDLAVIVGVDPVEVSHEVMDFGLALLFEDLLGDALQLCARQSPLVLRIQ
jgi:hypothetical protein